MRNIRVGIVLKQAGLNSKKRIYHWNLDSITFQQKFHEILIKNSTFDLQWIAWIIRTSTVIIEKNKNVHLNSEPLSELKNSKNEVSLRLYLKKARFIEEMIYSRNLHHLPLKMFKVFVAIVGNFNRHFFFVRQS